MITPRELWFGAAATAMLYVSIWSSATIPLLPIIVTFLIPVIAVTVFRYSILQAATIFSIQFAISTAVLTNISTTDIIRILLNGISWTVSAILAVKFIRA